MPIVIRVEHNGLILSATKSPGPRPDNFVELGIPRHPPKAGKFITDEVPFWNSVDLAKALNRVLSVVSHRATSGVTFRLEYRPGKRLKDGRFEYPASQDLLFFSRAFDLAGQTYPAMRPVAAARKWAHQFCESWNIDTFNEGYKVGGYIYKIGVALWMNKRRYSDPKKEAEREWYKRYRKARGAKAVKRR
jgi:hypothetical protein